jgi:hypothetical protein
MKRFQIVARSCHGMLVLELLRGLKEKVGLGNDARHVFKV